jgi:pimeloyl-ACP methyl ester carboxylesterase
MMDESTQKLGVRSTGWTIARKCFLTVLVLLLLTPASGIVFQRLSTYFESRRFSPPGRLYEVNGRVMHLRCAGSGRPTVVLESGLLHDSRDWLLIEPVVANFTRVCSYDRAGYGWSDYRSGPRDAAAISDELAALLAEGDETPPFILVGHSLGGIFVRQFALRHPGTVVGMVFVDSSHEQQLAHFPPPGNSILRSQQYFRKAFVANEFGIPRLQHACGLDAIRPELEAEAIYIECQPTRWLTALHEIEIFVSPPAMPARGMFGSMPIEVLTRDFDLEDDPAERAARPMWIQLQKELAALSLAGNWRVVKGASHAIHIDKPDEVVTAIRQVWNASRKSSLSSEASEHR